MHYVSQDFTSCKFPIIIGFLVLITSFSWVDDTNYPLARGDVAGTVTGQTKAMIVVYDSIDETFNDQSRGYLYHQETDANGLFNISNIRPGAYRVVAYPLAGQGSENTAEVNVTVIPNELVNVELNLPEPSNVLWSIGEANRRANEFRYSDELRNFYWHTLPPKNLTYYINQSDYTKDWYYSQGEGIWEIVYEDHPDDQPRTLRVALAAASGSLIFNITNPQYQINFNDVSVHTRQYDNDKAIYRDALQSGSFHVEVLNLLPSHVRDGRNVVKLRVLAGGVMYDAVSLTKGTD